jgi:hypothetical protein
MMYLQPPAPQRNPIAAAGAIGDVMGDECRAAGILIFSEGTVGTFFVLRLYAAYYASRVA